MERNYVDEYIDLIIAREKQCKAIDDLDEKEYARYETIRNKAYETLRPKGREIDLLIKTRKYKKTIATLTEKLSKIFNEK